MQLDTDLVLAVRNYMQSSPHLTAYDIVRHFSSMGIPDEKVLFVLKEIQNGS